ncbi:MAG: RdgB/HAM1 family non-canonical purine NTP pyrophosphatase [Oligoflexia bacterium]|nr:RdgB/HAM1 family non-canonical purine NTP pyrophosphatase [Oligoflexia bacterium]
MELWVATTNKGKHREIRELFLGLPIEVRAASELPAYTAPPENGATFQDNARIKARFLKAMKQDAWILADDSGLEVEALKGLPGVHSARYAGPKARDVENNSKLLKAMQLQSTGENRLATMKCVMCLISPDGQEHFFEGLLKGQIGRDMRGQNGFGYDPVFIADGNQKTMAELTLAEKNRISHRGQALKAVKAFLQTQLN